MTLTKTTEHVGEALANLIEQFKNKPKMAAFLTALVNQIQDLEDASFELYLDRWIDSAVGVQLDGLGAIIGEPRLGRGDDEYRLAIKARIQINFSEATPEDILTALVNFYNRTYQMIEIPPAAFIIRLVDAWVTGVDPDPQDFVELLNSVNGAGIKAWFQYSLVDDDMAFTFASGDALEASETQGFGVDPLFVAVASTGTNRVMTSVDGIDWTARAAAENNEWQSVTHGGLFVAVSSDGTNRVMTSPNGIDWIARVAAEQNEWRSVTFGAGLFVAVASSGTNRVMTSPDGIAWTARVAAAANEWQSVTYDDGLFVAVSSTGDNRVMTSPNGIDWTARQSITGPDVIIDGDMETTGPDVIVDGDMEAVGVGAWGVGNGATLTKDVTDPHGGTQALRIARNGVNNPYASQTCMTITKTYRIKGWARGDGATGVPRLRDSGLQSLWTGTNSTSYQKFDIVSKAAGTDIWLYSNCNVGTDFVQFDDVEVTDETVACAAWTAANSALLSKQEDPHGGAQCLRVEYGGTFGPYAYQGITIGKTYRAKGWARGDGVGIPRLYLGGSYVWIGTTSTSWQAFDVVAVAANTVVGLFNYAGSGYVEFDDVEVIVDNAWESVIYGDGLFVAVSSTGDDRIMTSPDGVVWIARTAAELNAWRSITHDKGLFVAVSSDGTNRVQTSPDGITWTARVAAENNEWRSVAHDNGLFVAVSSTGTNQVMTSPDGTVWTARAEAEANAWESIERGYATGGIMSEIVEV